jgi:type II secretory pathway pseudopilin PulG
MTSMLSRNQTAFTLVELLITVSVLVLVLTTGAVNYLRFLNKQNLYKAGSAIEVMIKDARSKAQNGFLGDEEIGFCSKLAAVEVFSILNAENKITLSTQLRCENDDLLTYESYLLDHNNVTLSQNFRISFLPLRGANISLGGSSVSSGSATLNSGEDEVILNFDKGGNVSVQYQ